jgi:hypothetical protein
MRGIIAFTICSKNFLASAKTLHQSLMEHHPGSTFYVFLCDDASDISADELPFKLIELNDLGVVNIDTMINRYNITELNTSLKPFAFLWLATLYPNEMLFYFDPDILVVSAMDEILSLRADSTVNCILTPHLLEPAEFAEMSEYRILEYGTFNFGFVALRATSETMRIMSWWSRRLEERCVIDTAHQLFVDQRWGDLFPSFVGGTAILRHPGYNVAYWNLSQRRLDFQPSRDGRLHWIVNTEPLRFFHFSGSVLGYPGIFSRHSSQFVLGTNEHLDRLFRHYVDLVDDNGRNYYSTLPYSFSWGGIEGRNEHTPSPA